MKRLIAVCGLCAAACLPVSAFAQSKAMTPTMEQCQGGYKADYMKSMNWSKATFDKACSTMMKNNKKM